MVLTKKDVFPDVLALKLYLEQAEPGEIVLEELREKWYRSILEWTMEDIKEGRSLIALHGDKFKAEDL